MVEKKLARAKKAEIRSGRMRGACEVKRRMQEAEIGSNRGSRRLTFGRRHRVLRDARAEIMVSTRREEIDNLRRLNAKC